MLVFRVHVQKGGLGRTHGAYVSGFGDLLRVFGWPASNVRSADEFFFVSHRQHLRRSARDNRELANYSCDPHGCFGGRYGFAAMCNYGFPSLTRILSVTAPAGNHISCQQHRVPGRFVQITERSQSRNSATYKLSVCGLPGPKHQEGCCTC